MNTTAATLAEIAKTHLHLDTLETRKSDGLDFSDQAVWSIKAALEAAFAAGQAAQAAAPARAKAATTIGQVTVDTRPYRRSHLREPRGTGSWAFQIGRDEENLFWHNGTYGEARKAAQAEARIRGASIIYAQP